MKNKLKKIFENAVWWSGVVMVGLILGVSLQFVRAWTEPTDAPPGGNVGAPINTSNASQNKSGILGVGGLLTTYLNVPEDVPVPGDVLTAQESFLGSGVSDGKVAWAAGGGGGTSFIYYCNFEGGTATTNICHDSGDSVRKFCPPGFKQIHYLGSWGYCGASNDGGSCSNYFRPPGAGCFLSTWFSFSTGDAYVCSQ